MGIGLFVKRLPVLAVLLVLLSSCAGRDNGGRIFIQNDFYWMPCGAESTVDDAEEMRPHFKKFSISYPNNIKRLVGTEGSYVWLRADFIIPEELRGKDLGLFVNYIHFADRVWVNGVFVGSNGNFPPDERSALFVGHEYFFPQNVLNQDGMNTLYIKVWAHGRSDISDVMFIGEFDDVTRTADIKTFFHSRIYLIFEGMMFVTFLLFFMIFMGRKKERANLTFALLNVCTMVFLCIFFAPDVPWYKHSGISYIKYMQFTLCCGIYFIVFAVSKFIGHFLRKPFSRHERIAMLFVLLLQVILTVYAPDYDYLIKICPLMVFLLFVQMGFGLRKFFLSLSRRRTRVQALVLLAGFSPCMLGMVSDLFLRYVMENTNYPFITIFGWQVTVVAFIMILSMRYTNVYARNEYLNRNLKKEIEIKTLSLSTANERLESEIKRSNVDLEMASIVQQKFFPFPGTVFKGWDVAICYNPVAKVSGDMYDYYFTDERLDGFSLFDVSGHGISASLITMLAKNIVFRAFSIVRAGRPLSSALYRINEEMIEEKGDIENYMTGLLFKFSDFDGRDRCTVDMANAGHPHPILYRAESDTIGEIVHGEGQFQYGAIGIRDIDVSFPDIHFEMGEGDVLVFFTDGLTESMNTEHEQFGKERVMDIIQRNSPKDAQSILEDLIDGLYDFTRGVPRDDDLTIVVLKRENSFNFIEELAAE